MAIKNRRLAGMRLAGRPDVDVTEQLRIANNKLKALNESQQNSYDNVPESLGSSFEVDGHRVSLDANARPLSLGELNLEEGKQYFGNQKTYEELSRNLPQNEYSMAWSVDGSYSGGTDLDPRTRVKIARQVQREWDKVIAKMPENSVVVNSPVGAGEGDYGRADLYMAAGFGPVQQGGQQYGIVHKGRIQPLSPMGTDDRHASHLAKRARMAGDVDLEKAIISATEQQQKLNNRPYDYDGPDRRAADAKGYGGYDDDGYDYDDDYTPPAGPDDLRRAAKGGGRYGNSTGLIPEIARRESVLDELNQGGFDRGNRDARWPDTRSTERADYENFEPNAEEIGEFRDLQVQLLNDPNFSAVRNVADVFNRQFPRPLPQRLDGPPERGYRGYRRGSGQIRNVSQLDQLPPEQRRDAAIDLIRREIDDRVASQGMDYNEFPQKQASLKNAMVETDDLVSDILGNGSLTQELYRDSDVAALRELQAAVGLVGGMRPDYQQIAQSGVTNRTDAGYRRRGRRRRGAPIDPNEGRGYAGEVVDLPAGEMNAERRALSPEQQLQRQFLTRPNTADVSGLDMSLESSIEGINGWLSAQGPAGDMWRSDYGNNITEMTAGLRPDPQMSDSAIRQILHSADTQPGRFDRTEVGTAYLTMLQRNGGGAQSLDPNELRNTAILQELAQNDRGPMAPIRRNPMATGQMEVDVPGVGPLRRPNAFVPEDTQLLPNYLQPRPDNTPRQPARQMAVAPQGTGRLFDEFLDAQVDATIRRPQSATPALQRGPDASIIAARQRRLAEIRGEAPGWNPAPYPEDAPAARVIRPAEFSVNPTLPSPPTTVYRADGSVEGGTMRDQMAYLDAVERVVRGAAPRQPQARQLELSIPQNRYADAPSDMSMDEFLAWRDI